MINTSSLLRHRWINSWNSVYTLKKSRAKKRLKDPLVRIRAITPLLTPQHNCSRNRNRYYSKLNKRVWKPAEEIWELVNYSHECQELKTEATIYWTYLNTTISGINKWWHRRFLRTKWNKLKRPVKLRKKTKVNNELSLSISISRIN